VRTTRWNTGEGFWPRILSDAIELHVACNIDDHKQSIQKSLTRPAIGSSFRSFAGAVCPRAPGERQQVSCFSAAFESQALQDLVDSWNRFGTLNCAVVFLLDDATFVSRHTPARSIWLFDRIWRSPGIQTTAAPGLADGIDHPSVSGLDLVRQRGGLARIDIGIAQVRRGDRVIPILQSRSGEHRDPVLQRGRSNHLGAVLKLH